MVLLERFEVSSKAQNTLKLQVKFQQVRSRVY